jgi:hypothetical protein
MIKNLLVPENIKSIAKICTIKNFQFFNTEITLIVQSIDILEILLFFKRRPLYQFKNLTVSTKRVYQTLVEGEWLPSEQARKQGLLIQKPCLTDLRALIAHCLFVSVNSNNNFPLLQFSLINLCVLTVFMCSCSLWNGCLVCFQYESFSNTIANDYLSFSSRFITGISSLICLFLIKQYLIDQKINSFEYIIILLFAILGLFLLCSANDLTTTSLALELQSLSFYILTALKKNSSYSVESGLKYFILGYFLSGLFLFVASLIYGELGTVNSTKIKDLHVFHVYSNKFRGITTYPYEISTVFNILSSFNYSVLLETGNFILIGLLFVFVSFFFKLALATFHLRSLDIYENHPTSSTFFFAVVPKLSIFIVLLRFSCSVLFTDLFWSKSFLRIHEIMSFFKTQFKIKMVAGLDTPFFWQMGFQDPASFWLMSEHLLFALSMAVLLAVWLVVCCGHFFIEHRKPNKNKVVLLKEFTSVSWPWVLVFFMSVPFIFYGELLEIPVTRLDPETFLEEKQETPLCLSPEKQAFNALILQEVNRLVVDLGTKGHSKDLVLYVLCYRTSDSFWLLEYEEKLSRVDKYLVAEKWRGFFCIMGAIWGISAIVVVVVWLYY